MDVIQGWIPTVLMLVGLVAQAALLKEQVRVLTKRLSSVESKIDAVTPRLGEVERLRRDTDEHEMLIREMRDALLAQGSLQPAPQTRRTRTPAAGMPSPPASRDSEEG